MKLLKSRKVRYLNLMRGKRNGLHRLSHPKQKSDSRKNSRILSYSSWPSCACRFQVMRIIHKCPGGQGSGSASPKGPARALALSQNYRFVNNSQDYRTYGRRPQNFPQKFSLLCKDGRAKTLQSSGRNSGGAADEINSRLEPALAEFIVKQRSSAASWFKLKQLTEPSDHIIASSPLQDRAKP